MNTENMQFDLAVVTSKGLLYKNILYTNPSMVKNHWFELAGRDGNWEVPILYSLNKADHILLLDIEQMEIATAVSPIIEVPQEIIEAYYEAMENLKNQLRYTKSPRKDHIK